MKLELEQSLQAIIKDERRGDDPIPDPLRFSYYSVPSNKKAAFEKIESLLNDRQYKVGNLLFIDVPKDNFTIRPMSRPDIEDWIVYQGLVNYLIEKIYIKLSKRSFSLVRFGEKGSAVNGWKEFDAKSRELFSSGYTYAVKTDISGYFENIDIEQLRIEILKHLDSQDSNSEEITNFLITKVLSPWSAGRIKNFGLPQGPSASSFLGDLYLNELDKDMEAYEGYWRYMDDIRVFCKTEQDAKVALIKIIKCLRKYKLNINSKKTRILKRDEIDQELFDPQSTILATIQEAFDSRNKDTIEALVPLLVDEIFTGSFDSKNYFDRRHLNFSIYRLSILKSSGVQFDESKVVREMIRNFVSRPQHANDFCKFFTLFPDEHKIFEWLIKFIFSNQNIYEWQELHILRALLEVKYQLDSSTLRLFYERFMDRNSHHAVRSMYALIIGSQGDQSYRELLIEEFENIQNNELEKYLVLATQQAIKQVKGPFYNRAKEKVLPIFFIDYVKSLKSPMYFTQFDRPKIENFESASEERYY